VHYAHPSSLVRFQGSFPCTPITDIRVRGRLHWQRTLVVPSIYVRYVPGPTCRGSVPLYVPPFSYKRGGTQRYNSSSLRPNSGSQVHTSSEAQYNTQWSRVLRSGSPNHSKPLRVLVCSSPNLVTGKTLRPLLILGFRAGAFRHPAGDFLSDNGPKISQDHHQDDIIIS
jgi:hypothetical protein